MKTKHQTGILEEIAKELYIALFGKNFVLIDKLQPAEHKEVIKILSKELSLAEQRGRDKIVNKFEAILAEFEDYPDKCVEIFQEHIEAEKGNQTLV